MSTRSSAANLVQSMKDLSLEWQETKSSWRDVKSAEFEGAYLDLLPNHIARAMSAIEEIDGLLRKVRSDCE
jgi:hypothetical protein